MGDERDEGRPPTSPPAGAGAPLASPSATDASIGRPNDPGVHVVRPFDAAPPFGPPGDASAPRGPSVPPSPGGAPPPDPAPRAFVFTATGGAYFRIWIVNLLLTIVTLGFYSPWAKVRRLRYFYGATTFDGSPFEFHGRPFALFKGRIVGLVLFVAYSQAVKLSLALWLAVVAVLLALMPWLLWKSFRFRLANSSYRGIRFAFTGTLGRAYVTFLPLMAVVVGPTLFLVVAQRMMGEKIDLRVLGYYYAALGFFLLFAPWFYVRLRAYQHGNARAGESLFGFRGRTRTAYDIAIKTILFSILMTMVGALAGLAVGGLAWLVVGRPSFEGARPIVPFAAGIVVFYLLILSTWSFNRAMTQNFVWNASTLADARFTSRVGRFRLWWIEVVNIAATLATLGFFWPFAVVRSMRYRITSLSWTGDSERLVAASADGRVGATGEETAEIFGLDIAL